MPKPLSISAVLFVLLACPGGAAGQLPVDVAIEGQAGYAYPRGDFAARGVRATPSRGSAFAIGGRVRLDGGLSLVAAGERFQYGCGACVAFGLDTSIEVTSGQLALDMRPWRGPLGIEPWFRAGGVLQTVAYTAGSERMESRAGVGWSAGAGLAIPFDRRLELLPGVGFRSVTAKFDFPTLPNRSMAVEALIIEVRGAVRF